MSKVRKLIKAFLTKISEGVGVLMMSAELRGRHHMDWD
jgi:hypothetical protein